LEVLVELADGAEALGGQERDDLVGFAPEVGEGLGGADGDREDEPRRALGADRAEGYAGRGAGGDAVVRDDHRTAAEGDRRTPGAVGGLAPADLIDLGVDLFA